MEQEEEKILGQGPAVRWFGNDMRNHEPRTQRLTKMLGKEQVPRSLNKRGQIG